MSGEQFFNQLDKQKPSDVERKNQSKRSDEQDSQSKRSNERDSQSKRSNQDWGSSSEPGKRERQSSNQSDGLEFDDTQTFTALPDEYTSQQALTPVHQMSPAKPAGNS